MAAELNDIEVLITKSLAGEATTVEEQQLSTWLGESAANKKRYADFKKVFEEGTKFYAHTPGVSSIDINNEWARFRNAVAPNSQASDNGRSLASESSWSASWMRIAAALLVIVVSGVVVNYFIKSNSETVFQTAENTQAVTLPDGSQIVLNNNSKLSYTSSFGEAHREVTLQGEAFFEVSHDATKPFIISAGSTQIEVLGTSFNVFAYESASEVSVTVETGIVKLSVPEIKSEIKLTAGNRGVYQKADKQLITSVNTDANFLSWKTHNIKFIESDLRSVVESINKAYNTNIRIATTVADTCVITVTFEGQTLEAVLNVLKTTLNLTITEKDGQIEIVSAGC